MANEEEKEKAVELVLTILNDDEAVTLAERILEDYFDEPRLRNQCPIVYRERVTKHEREQLTQLLAMMRMAGDEIDLKNIVKLVPILGTKFYCPNCGGTVDGMLEHYNDTRGEWKCPLNPTRSNQS